MKNQNNSTRRTGSPGAFSDTINAIRSEIGKAFLGNEEIIDKVLMVIIARGHLLLEDIPGVGKTTLALALSRAVALSFRRVQFTPDVVPSDITGFNMYERQTGRFRYVPGAAMCSILLADEINRTSSKTQSALLEVMQEGQITVDGSVHKVPQPFMVIATQNPVGTAGTQPLPEGQLDRFTVQLSIGYPDRDAAIAIMKSQSADNPLDSVRQAADAETILQMQRTADLLYTDDKIYAYVAALCEETRGHPMIRLGISPRGALSICAAARARAFLQNRDFVIPEDVDKVFLDCCRHRLIPDPKARLNRKTPDAVLQEILDTVPHPDITRSPVNMQNPDIPRESDSPQAETPAPGPAQTGGRS